MTWQRGRDGTAPSPPPPPTHTTPTPVCAASTAFRPLTLLPSRCCGLFGSATRIDMLWLTAAVAHLPTLCRLHTNMFMGGPMVPSGKSEFLSKPTLAMLPEIVEALQVGIADPKLPV